MQFKTAPEAPPNQDFFGSVAKNQSIEPKI
jgi:hypothetical protein